MDIDWFIYVCIQKKLTTLDIAANRVKKIENINHLTELQEFWVCTIREVDQEYYLFLGLQMCFLVQNR